MNALSRCVICDRVPSREDSKFCEHCGATFADQKVVTSEQNPKPKDVAVKTPISTGPNVEVSRLDDSTILLASIAFYLRAFWFLFTGILCIIGAFAAISTGEEVAIIFSLALWPLSAVLLIGAGGNARFAFKSLKQFIPKLNP